jgi:hypothetical protein
MMKWSVGCAVRGAVRRKTRGLGIGLGAFSNANSADDVDYPSRAYHEEDLVERIVERLQGGVESRQERAQHRERRVS